MKDTRSRIKYIMPDKRPITVIVGHGQEPADVITIEISPDDPLWDAAQPPICGSGRRIVYATKSIGL